MFYNAAAFNQSLAAWNVSRVTNMGGMFFRAAAFAQDITGWTTTALKLSTNMFPGADAWLKQFTRDSAAGGGDFDGPPDAWSVAL
jgi:surface protein